MRIMRTPKTFSIALGIMPAAALAWLFAHAETTHVFRPFHHD